MTNKTRKSLAIVTADTHLKPHTWVKRPEINGDQYRGLRQAVKVANDFDVPLFILGDVFDKMRPDSNSVAQFIEETSQLKHQSYAIQGNHDKAYPPWFSLSAKVTHFDRQVVLLSGYKFIGYDYRSVAELRRELLELPVGMDVVMLHQAWAEIQGVGYDAKLSELLPGCLAISGDCHINTAGSVYSAIDGSPIRFVSPGNTAIQALNENPNKFVTHLFVTEGANIVEFEQIPITTRPMYSVGVATEEALASLLGELYKSATLPDDHKPILKVLFPESFVKPRAALEGEFNDKVHLFLNEEEEELVADISVTADKTPLLTLADAIIAVEGISQPFRELLAGSIAATDLNAYFNTQHQQFLEGPQYGVQTTSSEQLLPTT